MTQLLTTSEIIAAFRAQNWVALEGLVQQYTEMLLKGALSLGFRDQQADDLVQSVWMTFFEVVSTFEGRSQVKTFLYGILINKSRELRRETKKNDNHDPIEEVMEERFDQRGHWTRPPISPDRFIESLQNLKVIQDCIEHLPVNQRAAFCFREVDDLEMPEICKILDVTNTNLGVLLYRAKNRLRECIERKVGQN
ncbi:MAG: hypothetical protein A2622_09585 [Bdellovibrionales bacterium RIFCSPHIGHO2_01_FULL_40_29]|nr:MAG: hypothetical protein A2622_09585 [Bdellovibrionales bacterium RIFCSPHIGHO2_01_FULL_40_29]OFZ33527.1 MAG: hypothetical protein A3D17_00035 [Bdellovibrionales bacterium RIFCSPHIGHO2_02_FULL_40_15]